MIEEPEELEEKLDNPVVQPDIYSEESVMAEEGEGEVHNVHGEEDRIGGRGRGIARGRGGGRGT